MTYLYGLFSIEYDLLVLLVLCYGPEEVGVVLALLLHDGPLCTVRDHHWDSRPNIEQFLNK